MESKELQATLLRALWVMCMQTSGSHIHQNPKGASWRFCSVRWNRPICLKSESVSSGRLPRQDACWDVETAPERGTLPPFGTVPARTQVYGWMLGGRRPQPGSRPPGPDLLHRSWGTCLSSTRRSPWQCSQEVLFLEELGAVSSLGVPCANRRGLPRRLRQRIIRSQF